MRVSFELTMPNVGSWNGKWSGAESKYYLIKSYGIHKASQERIKELLDGKEKQSWYYNFGDGWGASVKMEIVDTLEAKKRLKISKRFCGYDWMIDSIIKYGKILSSPPETKTELQLNQTERKIIT